MMQSRSGARADETPINWKLESVVRRATRDERIYGAHLRGPAWILAFFLA